MPFDAQPGLDLAAKWIAEGKAEDCLPRDKIPDILGAPLSAYRYWSLVAEG